MNDTNPIKLIGKWVECVITFKPIRNGAPTKNIIVGKLEMVGSNDVVLIDKFGNKMEVLNPTLLSNLGTVKLRAMDDEEVIVWKLLNEGKGIKI